MPYLKYLLIPITIYIEPKCDNYLGMLDGNIADSQISVSSVWDSNHLQPRLHSTSANGQSGSWNPSTYAAGQWLEVDFLFTTKVTGIITQGRYNNAEWVTQYQIAYSDDGDNWNIVTDADGNDEVSHCDD